MWAAGAFQIAHRLDGGFSCLIGNKKRFSVAAREHKVRVVHEIRLHHIEESLWSWREIQNLPLGIPHWTLAGGSRFLSVSVVVS